MELVKGFKQTDIGKIPEDWHTQLFKNYCWYQEGPGLRNWQFTSAGIKVINVTNLVEGYLDLDKTERYISLNEYEKMYKHFLIDENDILVASSGNSYAKVAVVRKQDLPLVMNTSVIRFKPTKKLDYKFLLAFLNSKLFKNQIDLMITGGAQPNFGPYHLNKLIINIPPSLGEQIAIASALSDSVDLINNLNKLIEKKKNIKHGAMQQLLKPKRDWVESNLTDVLDYIHGKAHEQDIVEVGKFIVVNSKFVSTEGAVTKYSNSNYCPARKNDLLMVLSDLPNGKALAKCFFVEEDNKFTVNQRVCIWRSKGTDQRFLFYVLNRNKYFLALNDGVSQTHILNHHIEKCKIFLPIKIEEQIEIATILTDMDNEIISLEKKLAKAILIKHGMIQNLLTGKIRLV
jgi:type I restriction enzyme S subunit